MDDFTVRRDGHGTGRIERAFHIALAHFAALDGDDAMAVDPGDMPAGDPHIDRIDLTAGHELGVLDGAPDGLHGLLNIHHHALAHAVRGTGADPNDIHQAVFRQQLQVILNDPGGGLLLPDIKGQQLHGETGHRKLKRNAGSHFAGAEHGDLRLVFHIIHPFHQIRSNTAAPPCPPAMQKATSP